MSLQRCICTVLTRKLMETVLVYLTLVELKRQLESKLEQTFIGYTIKQKFLFEARNFYGNSLVHLNRWTMSVSMSFTEA